MRRFPSWARFLLLGAILAATYHVCWATGVSAVWSSLLYCAVSGASAVAVLVGVHRYRPRYRSAWLLLAAGQLTYTVADVVYYVRTVIGEQDSYPSVADWLYLTQYGFFCGALCALLLRFRYATRIPDLVDAAVISISTALPWWIFIIGPVSREPSMSTGERVVTLAYPAFDLAVVALVALLVLQQPRITTSCRLLVAMTVLMLTADAAYAVQQHNGTYTDGTWIDATWLASYIVLGLAALHPSMRWADVPALAAGPEPGTVTSAGSAPSVVRVVLLGAVSLVAPAMLVLRHDSGPAADRILIAVVCAILFVLVLARMAALVAAQRQMATTDPLTGLRNRGYFQERLEAETGTDVAGRVDVCVGLIIVDLDHFKRINDGFGHPAGDRVLRVIADRLRSACRTGDVVARYGGEEFALLLPATTAAEASTIAERVRHTVSTEPIAIGEGHLIQVTASLGVATTTSRSTIQLLVRSADDALYRAKHAGRDRVVVGRFLIAEPVLTLS